MNDCNVIVLGTDPTCAASDLFAFTENLLHESSLLPLLAEMKTATFQLPSKINVWEVLSLVYN